MRQQRRKEAATAELQASTVLDLPRSSRPSAARQPGTFGAMFASPPNSPEHAPEYAGKQQGFVASCEFGVRDAGIMRTAGQPGHASSYVHRAGNTAQQPDSSFGRQSGTAGGVGGSMQQDVRFGSSRWTEATALEFFMSKSKAKRQQASGLQPAQGMQPVLTESDAGKQLQLVKGQNTLQQLIRPLAEEPQNQQHSLLSQQLAAGQPTGTLLQQMAVQSAASTPLQATYKQPAGAFSTSPMKVGGYAGPAHPGSHQGISMQGPAAGAGGISVSTSCQLSSACTGVSDMTCFEANVSTRESSSPSTASDPVIGHMQAHGLWPQQQPAAAASAGATMPGSADTNRGGVCSTHMAASNPAPVAALQSAPFAPACALPLHVNSTTSSSYQPAYSSQFMPGPSTLLAASAPGVGTGSCDPHTPVPVPWGLAVSTAAVAGPLEPPARQIAQHAPVAHSTLCASGLAPLELHHGSNASTHACWSGQAMVQRTPAAATTTLGASTEPGHTTVQDGMAAVLAMPAAGCDTEYVTRSWAHTSTVPQQHRQEACLTSCPASGQPSSYSGSSTAFAEANLQAGHVGMQPVPDTHIGPGAVTPADQQHELHVQAAGTSTAFNLRSSQAAYAASAPAVVSAGPATVGWVGQEGLLQHDEEFDVADFNLDSDELLNHWDAILAT